MRAMRRTSFVNTALQLRSSAWVSTMIDDSSASIVIAGLKHCRRLTFVDLGMASNAANSRAIAMVTEQNKSSLRRFVVPCSDGDLPLIAPSIKACRQLVGLHVGSRALTNASAPAIADTLRCHHGLKRFGLTGGIDDHGFTSISSSLLDILAQLEKLTLHWTMLSASMLS